MATRRTWILLCAAGLCAACAAPQFGSPPSQRSPWCDRPVGSFGDVKTPPGQLDEHGFAVTVGAFRSCGSGEAVEVAGHGTRRFVQQNRADRACDGRPDQPARCRRRCVGRPLPDEPCDRVSPIRIGEEVQRALAARGMTISLSIAACGERPGTSGWGRPGLVVHDWRDVDAAIAMTAERLRAWRAAGSLRVVVRPMACGVAL